MEKIIKFKKKNRLLIRS